VQKLVAERSIARGRAVADPCSPIDRGFKRMQGRKSSRSRLARGIALAAAIVGAASALAAPAGAAENFVIGDENATVGTQVEFWGAQWWKLNSLSGGLAPARSRASPTKSKAAAVAV